MTTEQLGLACEPHWDDDEFDEIPADLRGQRIPDRARIDDIDLTGRYL
ncbi:hypothetical protein ACFRLW_18335 [Streptomyces sp. NPDC056728]